jgi:hypothetical protein
MAITSDIWWGIGCDRCGEPFPENEAGGPYLADSEENAREMVTEFNGEIDEDDKILCASCIEEGDEDA